MTRGGQGRFSFVTEVATVEHVFVLLFWSSMVEEDVDQKGELRVLWEGSCLERQGRDFPLFEE